MYEWMHWTIQTAILWVAVGIMILVMAILHKKLGPANRRGWLPYPTTRGVRLFMSLMVMCGIGIIWLRFVRYTFNMSMWGAFIVSIVVGAIIMKYA